MKDKEMIEEMANDIKSAIDNAEKDSWYIKQDLPIWIVEKLGEKYQPKLSKDSVVLSREEYEILTKDIETPTDEILKKLIVGKNMLVEKAIEDTRKETAEKIFNKLDDVQENLSKKIKQLKEPFNYVSMSSKEKEGYKNGILAAKSIVTSFKSQLAKQSPEMANMLKELKELI